MSLDLNPQAETILRQEAEREGISIDELIVRRFASHSPVPEETATPDAEKERVLALLRQRQKEYGLPEPPGGFKTLRQLFAEWDAQDAQMTDAEREAEHQFWEEYERDRPLRPLQL